MGSPVLTVTNKAEHRHEHAGQFYYFCSAKCQGKFASDPLHYVVARTVEALPTKPDAIDGTIYTCPMHPEV
ncbi:MAG: YHS domain-containing protein, partial [Rhodoferax sp.]|nr:YHS domain-containing protein [Rhodoferax sp.]